MGLNMCSKIFAIRCVLSASKYTTRFRPGGLAPRIPAGELTTRPQRSTPYPSRLPLDAFGVELGAYTAPRLLGSPNINSWLRLCL